MKSSMKYAIYGLSAVSLPFFIFMPSVNFLLFQFKFFNYFIFSLLKIKGVMVYVCTTNAFSLATSFLFRNENVQKALGIPILSAAEKQRLKDEAKKKKGFLEGITDSFDNRKLVQEIKERENLHLKKFGQGARIQTFKQDPTKKIGPK